MNKVYVNKTAMFLPNEPVANDDMELFLGNINGKPSKSKKIILRNNGIKTRYYALDKEGKPTHTNADLAAEVVKQLINDSSMDFNDLELLACGTTSPDQLLPSHAVMVHGLLPNTKPMEVISMSAVCCAGMHAMKYAYMAIRSGEVSNAIVTGSERMSANMMAHKFDEEANKLTELNQNPYISFDKEFLRWMLSDGAAGFLLSDQPNKEGLNITLDWIEGVSYANEMETCMYMGAEKREDGTLKGFTDFTPIEIAEKSIMSVKQDISLLDGNIVRLGGQKLKEIFDKKGIGPQDIDYFLPHISSEFFRSKIVDLMKYLGEELPQEKWFINLSETGNIGTASVFAMMHDLLKSGKLKEGDRILGLVPESGRFNYMYCMFTVC